MAATILIIDRYDVVRTALRQWLNVVFPSIHVMETTSKAGAIECIREQVPTLVIIDVLLPGSTGLSATRQIRSALPLVPIVILTMYEDEEYRTEALQAGANAFIPKREMHQELIPQLRVLLAEVKV